MIKHKQNGQIIDHNSERSLTKTWDGILLELFNVGDRSIAYSWNPNLSVKVEAKEKPLGRVVFELYDDIAPRTVENFLRIADGVTVGGRKLNYKNTTIDKILPFRGLWGGFLGGSIYGRYFPDESFKLVQDEAGILTTANPKID